MSSDSEVTGAVTPPAPINPPGKRLWWTFYAASALVAAFVYYCSWGADRSNSVLLRWECFSIAKSLAAGDGYSSPFFAKTGPTAWKQPVLPTIMAGLIWACEGDESAIQKIIVFGQIHVLILTGVLVIAAARETSRYPNVISFVAAAIYCTWLYAQYRMCFTQTGDCWLAMAAIDALIAGHMWFRPLSSRRAGAAWGIVGGVAALVNPIIGVLWFVLASVTAAWERRGQAYLVALLTCALVLAPWTVRNYLVFGRFIPVKSNLWYELYQSQCQTANGILRWSTRSSTHPNSSLRARSEYQELGEIAFVDRARELFLKSVADDPLSFADRIHDRFIGAMVQYEVYRSAFEQRYPLMTPLNKILHPLPLAAVVLLVFRSLWRPLHPAQWLVIAVYLLYLGPYVIISYFERYGIPLFGVKTLLIVWLVDELLRLVPRKAALSRP